MWVGTTLIIVGGIDAVFISSKFYYWVMIAGFSSYAFGGAIHGYNVVKWLVEKRNSK